MPTIQLKTDGGAHLGYLLISGTESLDSSVSPRDCILTGPKKEDGSIDHLLSRAMDSHQSVEHSAKVVASDAGIELACDIATSGRLTITLPDKHQGTWTFSGPSGDATGRCSLPEASLPDGSPSEESLS